VGAGRVCVALNCLLLSGLPPGLSAADVVGQCKAAEAWLTGPGRACATFANTM
jgi:hypothetical protein